MLALQFDFESKGLRILLNISALIKSFISRKGLISENHQPYIPLHTLLCRKLQNCHRNLKKTPKNADFFLHFESKGLLGKSGQTLWVFWSEDGRTLSVKLLWECSYSNFCPAGGNIFQMRQVISKCPGQTHVDSLSSHVLLVPIIHVVYMYFYQHTSLTFISRYRSKCTSLAMLVHFEGPAKLFPFLLLSS